MNPNRKSLSVLASALVLLHLQVGVWGAPALDTATQQVQKADTYQKLMDVPAQQAVPTLYKDKDEDKDVGVQYILQTKPVRHWLESFTDVHFGFTNNMDLTENAKTETALMISTVQAAFAPDALELKSGNTVSAKTGYRHQKFNYGKFTSKESTLNDADFDVSTFFFQSRYLAQERWITTLGVDYNRLLTGDKGEYDEFYDEYVPNLNIERRFKMGEKAIFTASGGLNYHLSHVDPPQGNRNDRIDEILMLAYLREITGKLVLQPYYRVQFTQYTQYPNRQRKDIVQTIGATGIYSITSNVSMRLDASFEQRDSEDPSIADYQKFDAGLATSLQVRF